MLKVLNQKLDGVIDSFFVNDSLPGIIVGIWTLGFTYQKTVGNTTMCYNPGLDAAIIVSVNEFDVKGGKSDAIFAKLADLLYPDKSFFK